MCRCGHRIGAHVGDCKVAGCLCVGYIELVVESRRIQPTPSYHPPHPKVELPDKCGEEGHWWGYHHID